MKRRFDRFTVLAVVAVLAAGFCVAACRSGKATKANRAITLLIDWKAEPTYAGFYIANAQGLYSKRGFDVTIVEGNGATVAAQLVGAGTYSIASCSGEATAIARAKGIPIKSLAVLYPNVPSSASTASTRPDRYPQISR